MLAELFTQHPSAGNFKGNPLDEYFTIIGKAEYGMGETQESIRLYGGRDTIRLNPGECIRAACECVICEITLCVFI